MRMLLLMTHLKHKKSMANLTNGFFTGCLAIHVATSEMQHFPAGLEQLLQTAVGFFLQNVTALKCFLLQVA